MNMNTVSPFHSGEQAVQRRMGVRDQIEAFARQVVRPYMPDQHRQFYAGLPFMVVAARDARQQPWVSLLTGVPGFVSSPSADELLIDAQFAPGDALHGELDANSDVGLLGIEFATRRRNRVNGRLMASERGIRLRVDQSFGNCPAFITPRDWRTHEVEVQPSAVSTLALSESQRSWIRSADTLFIASGHRGDGDAASFGMDASHRGGDPGFVAVPDRRTVVIPDYSGNNHFNTIGNLIEDPRVGLLFVDFTGGRLLQLTGVASIDWDSSQVAQYPGARRLIVITVAAVVEVTDALPMRWEAVTEDTRSFAVVSKSAESEDVVSFELAPRDQQPLVDYLPGQHLPIAVNIDGVRHQRTYSLSAAADCETYRLTVKREPMGSVSGYLHDRLMVGDSLQAADPAGDFFLQPGERRVVLISAGVGVTPMVSMLHALADPEEARPVLFVHGARDGAHHPLAEEVKALTSASHRLRSLVAYSQPRTDDQLLLDYDHHGRVNSELISDALAGDLDADYYLCGPVAFMAELSQALQAAGVPEQQIHAETFGPAA